MEETRLVDTSAVGDREDEQAVSHLADALRVDYILFNTETKGARVKVPPSKLEG